MCQVNKATREQIDWNKKVYIGLLTVIETAKDGWVSETRGGGYALYCKHPGEENWEITPDLKKGEILKIPRDTQLKILRFLV